MRKKANIADRILEHWASWRITEEIYIGTGPSSIIRFREPAGSFQSGSHPLYMGICDRRLSALNTDLFLNLGYRNTGILLMLYGMPGDEKIKVRCCRLKPDAVDSLKSRARVVALRHIPHTIKVSTNSSNETHRQTKDTGQHCESGSISD